MDSKLRKGFYNLTRLKKYWFISVLRSLSGCRLVLELLDGLFCTCRHVSSSVGIGPVFL